MPQCSSGGRTRARHRQRRLLGVAGRSPGPAGSAHGTVGSWWRCAAGTACCATPRDAVA